MTVLNYFYDKELYNYISVYLFKPIFYPNSL